MNDDIQRLRWANNEVKATISSARRTIEETKKLFELLEAMASPLITTEPLLRDRSKSEEPS